MKQPIIGRMRQNSAIMRTLAATIVVAFTMLTLQPAAMAVQNELAAEKQAPPAAADTPEAKLSQMLDDVKQTLLTVDEKMGQELPTAVEEQRLTVLHEQIAALDGAVMENFQAIEAHIARHNLAPVIMQRHHEAVSLYRKELASTLANLKRIQHASDRAEKRQAVGQARGHLQGKKLKRAQQPFDPNDLPFKSLQPDPQNKPKLHKDEFTAAGLHGNPPVQVAALGDFTFDQLPGASNPDYLAATVEVVLSDAIKAKAAELEHDPVRIYHWVLNNIEWQPAWGAMQDADLTLGARRGNAFDIASLTIALLRASGIPARYVHGTIEVPEREFRNWAGGFASIEAAANFAASGGIPITGIIEGGAIAKVRMEHVWVEAAIDYEPSRGAVNLDADAWVQLDPSYKQYEYMSGLDMAAIADIDVQALTQSLLESASQNEQEGWVQGLDLAGLEAANSQARQALEDHIKQMTDPTVGEVIGGRKVISHDASVLPSNLPYLPLVEGARYGDLPARVRPAIAFGVGADIFGDPIQRKSFAWAELNNRKVTLSFAPATAADEQALQSLLPEGEITDVSQLPASIPAYLVYMVPELRVDGNTVLSGAPLPLGSEVMFTYEVTEPGRGTHRYPNPVQAGSYLAVGIISSNVALARLENIKSKLEATNTKLESLDPGLRAGLTREDILGDMFYAGIVGYFAQYQALAYLTALSQKSHFALATSAGTYGYVPNVNYFFGIPRNITPGGMEMDLDRVAMVTSVDESGRERWRTLNFQLGALASTLEHAVPEQMYVSSASPGEAVSAVRALQKAAQAGQRIYHITPVNQATALPNIRQNALAMDEIRSALAVGKEVIAHTDPINVPGWKGAGYVITDPQTGVGAWKIGGGQNGGALDFGGVLYNILAAMHINWDRGVPGISGTVGFMGNILLLAGAINNFVNLVEHCSPVTAALVTSALAAFSWLVGTMTLGIVFGTVWTGFIFAIAFALIMAMLVNFINAVVVEAASAFCRLSERRDMTQYRFVQRSTWAIG